MVNHTSVTIQVEVERDDGQQQQQQPQDQHQHQQQGWLDSALKFHVGFGLLKLLTIARFRSIYIICEVIYLISLIEVTISVSPNQFFWYLYIVFGTLSFELLLWTNLSLVMWLVINFCLLLYALASSGLLAQVSDRFLQLVQPFDDMALSDIHLDF